MRILYLGDDPFVEVFRIECEIPWRWRCLGSEIFCNGLEAVYLEAVTSIARGSYLSETYPSYSLKAFDKTASSSVVPADNPISIITPFHRQLICPLQHPRSAARTLCLCVSLTINAKRNDANSSFVSLVSLLPISPDSLVQSCIPVSLCEFYYCMLYVLMLVRQDDLDISVNFGYATAGCIVIP